VTATLLSWLVFAPVLAQPKDNNLKDNNLTALLSQVVSLEQAGKYMEAIPIAERALELAERQLGSPTP
jgi:hypothetical protein